MFLNQYLLINDNVPVCLLKNVEKEYHEQVLYVYVRLTVINILWYSQNKDFKIYVLFQNQTLMDSYYQIH